MRWPIWLYLKREDQLTRIRRWGSRRPLRLVFTIIDEPPLSDFRFPASYLLAVGKLGLQYGPADGITEGWTSLPRGSKTKLLVEFKSGKAIGATWEAGR